MNRFSSSFCVDFQVLSSVNPATSAATLSDHSAHQKQKAVVLSPQQRPAPAQANFGVAQTLILPQPLTETNCSVQCPQTCLLEPSKVISACSAIVPFQRTVAHCATYRNIIASQQRCKYLFDRLGPVLPLSHHVRLFPAASPR